MTNALIDLNQHRAFHLAVVPTGVLYNDANAMRPEIPSADVTIDARNKLALN